MAIAAPRHGRDAHLRADDAHRLRRGGGVRRRLHIRRARLGRGRLRADLRAGPEAPPPLRAVGGAGVRSPPGDAGPPDEAARPRRGYLSYAGAWGRRGHAAERAYLVRTAYWTARARRAPTAPTRPQ